MGMIVGNRTIRHSVVDDIFQNHMILPDRETAVRKSGIAGQGGKKERNMKTEHIFMIRTVSKIISVMLFVLLSVSVFSSSLKAENISSGEADVSITVDTDYGEYRYSFDIVFYSMMFTYNLRSIACNEETGETYVNSGDWMMDQNKTDSVTLTVVNHSDTPVCVTASVNAAAFLRCGAAVERTGLSGEYLPACELISDGQVLVSQSEMILTLLGYPQLPFYQGIKTIYATICVTPASGYATNGDYYSSLYSGSDK